MKKSLTMILSVKKLLSIGLAVVLILCMSACASNQFIDRDIKKIPVECNDYWLELSGSKLNSGKKLNYEIFSSERKNFEREVYNKNGLCVTQKDKETNVDCEFIIDYQERRFQIDQEYMKQQPTYVEIDLLWLRSNNGKGNALPGNDIVSLCVTDSNQVFIITACTVEKLLTYQKRPTVLWCFDFETGKIQYCDYLKQEDGTPLLTRKNFIIVERE